MPPVPADDVTSIPSSIADAHEVLSRIRDPRRPRIRDQRDVESFAHLIHQLIRFLDLIVLVIARHRRPDLKMIQQLDGISGILRRNQIRLPLRSAAPGSVMSSRFPIGVAHKYNFPAITFPFVVHKARTSCILPACIPACYPTDFSSATFPTPASFGAAKYSTIPPITAPMEINCDVDSTPTLPL